MFSREELIREANRLCSTIEDAERRYKDLQEQRDGLLAACKEALAFGWFEPEHEPIIGKLKSAIEKAEAVTFGETNGKRRS